MNVFNIEIPRVWLVGATLNWVTSVANEISDSGKSAPVARQSRPLMQFTFDVMYEDVVEFENLNILCNGPANGFFARPPIDRYYLVTAQPLGTATGGAQVVQLLVTRGLTSWAALYPEFDSITIYANGVALVPVIDWFLGDDGEVTVTAPVGQTLTATFQYLTPFQFPDESLQIDLQATFEMPQQITIREIIGPIVIVEPPA